MTVAVRLIVPEDYDVFRVLRLESLRLLPDCFAADPVQEEAMPKEEWLKRLASASSFGGFIDGTLSGMVVFSRPSRPKLAHTGDIGAMYVRASAQGTGLADALMTALLDHASHVVEQVQLVVNAEICAPSSSISATAFARSASSHARCMSATATTTTC
jgi:GNAT superfamily N-acetyltransferase